jgi:hypothetical protein
MYKDITQMKDVFILFLVLFLCVMQYQVYTLKTNLNEVVQILEDGFEINVEISGSIAGVQK